MSTHSEQLALPTGTRLSEFEIQQVLGVGGFGIVYLALDHALQRLVAIKEYMPASLAGRDAQADVVVRHAAQQETYKLGLQSFINEARLLARFDHPSLVKVYRFWEAHGTAYMVMPYYKGLTLQQVRRDMSEPPDEAWLRRLINPLLGALDCLHREQVYHRDVAPDNILLLDDETGPGQGRPVLLDLGAARHVIGDHTQALTAIVKPSFAPIEQYAETAQLRQGPWTDVYALAAVVHFCITGRPPMPATARAVHDELPSLQQMSAGLASGFDRHFSAAFMQALDHALSVRPQDRPVSISAWREELSGQAAASAVGEILPATVAQTVLVRQPGTDKPDGHRAVEAQSYLTTVPAANVMHAPSAWLAPSPGDPVKGAEVAKTWPQGVVSLDVGESALAIKGVQPMPPEDPPAAQVQRRWWWMLMMLSLVGVAALWWGVRHQSSQAHLLAPSVAASSPAVASSAMQAAERRQRKETRVSDAAPTSEGSAAVRSKNTGKADDGALNPLKVCGNKMFIMRAICMKQHCVKPEYAAHPECERMRQQEAAQRSNMP